MQMHKVEARQAYTILIPAYNPDDALVTLVEKLRANGFLSIIVVNDGSGASAQSTFDAVTPLVDQVLTHDQNQGKGAALKTGLKYIVNTYPNRLGVITVDADGQHLPEDVVNVYEEGVNKPHHLIMGCRDFSGEEIPFRSRFGNQATRLVMLIGSGLKLKDTQTGLRAIPMRYARQLLDIPGSRYEFEMNMLTFTKRLQVPIQQTTIQTVYENENDSSHFRPILDSILIYRMFLMYSISSVASFLVDVGVYAVFIYLLSPYFDTAHVIVATVLARVISSLFNYFVNRKVVFHSKARRSLSKYFGLVVLQMAISALLVYLLFLLFRQGEVVLKIIVDSFLFFISYYVQKRWIFKK
ncbi:MULTISPECIES: bifunctional glycosyltransferase family 2/GtrA family protein [unclassified Exiguobacterium]|uniref:bifunctional glycosyltransferase family 2/GtrA family protein n=1 Tax=unclassified Exiguobacterium TaxID=2644629 RepID=UPI001BEA0AC9|nr:MULTISPECIES: bifunctional glycosyltransferase family 2/GtrA family protein [unclassified Exiguobacterium]